VSWHHPWLSLAGPESGDVVVLTPKLARWEYCGLHVLRLEPGAMRTVETGDCELFVLPLSGGLTIEVAASASPGSTEVRQGLTGRSSVFDRVTDFAYVGRDSTLRMISAQGAEVALPSARCQHRRPPKYAAAESVSVELRGAGPSTRQVNNFGTPQTWPHAEKLVACEVLTPAGNWSSYPPHKHDQSQGCRSVNEEIYFFRIAGPDGVTPSREGFGLQRAYTGPEHAAAGLDDVDETVEVRDGDIFVLPYGYHGPSVAAPGYPMYYLNVLAGPAEERSMAFCDDPMHGWVRDTWTGQPTDPRCPITSADGRRRR
jgi:5-deoxy-glucuronate isomerase